MAAHRESKVRLVKLPAKSPDLNPIERFWGYLRRRLLKMDLADLANGAPVLGQLAYRERIKRICRSQDAQRAAGNYARGLRKVCKEVLKKKGEATRG